MIYVCQDWRDAQRLGAFPILPEDLNSIPRTHRGWLRAGFPLLPFCEFWASNSGCIRRAPVYAEPLHRLHNTANEWVLLSPFLLPFRFSGLILQVWLVLGSLLLDHLLSSGDPNEDSHSEQKAFSSSVLHLIPAELPDPKAICKPVD